MKTVFRLLPLSLAFSAVIPVLSAQSTSVDRSTASSVQAPDLHKEIDRLILEDALVNAGNPDKKPVALPAEIPEQAVTLEPYETQSDKLPMFSNHRETVVDHFFRTGTIAQHFGANVTTTFWAKGDDGLMLNIAF